VHHEASSRAGQIHHSLRSQTSARPGINFDIPIHETDPTTQTLSRPRRVSRTQAEIGIVHVLLVEDNEISQKLLKKQLARAGCSVVTANDGVEAVEFLLKNASTHHDVSSTQNTGINTALVGLILMG